MTDQDKLHEAAEQIREETAEDAPEVAEHDRIAELEKQLEEANSKTLYAAAEMQNLRRRLEQEKVQAANYASAGFARDMLAIKDHLDRALAAVSDDLRKDDTAKNFLAGIESTARELDAVFARNGVTRIPARKFFAMSSWRRSSDTAASARSRWSLIASISRANPADA
jgi:molecular chaperone GrpE